MYSQRHKHCLPHLGCTPNLLLDETEDCHQRGHSNFQIYILCISQIILHLIYGIGVGVGVVVGVATGVKEIDGVIDGVG